MTKRILSKAVHFAVLSLALIGGAALVVAQVIVANLAVIVVTFASSDPPNANTILWTQQTIDQVEAYYSEQSYGRFTLSSDVFGIYTVPLDQNATRADVANAAKAAATAAGVDLSPYTRFFYISPQTTYVQAGWGDGSGAWYAGVPNQVVAPGFHVAAHELGHHVLGIPNHPRGHYCNDGTPLGGRNATCQDVEYIDSLDVMGYGDGHFNAVAKERLGWLAPQIVTTSGDYLIAPLETTGAALSVPIQTNKGSITFYLEYRQPIGFDGTGLFASHVETANVFNGVVLHLPLQEIFPTSTLLRMTPYDPLESGIINRIPNPALTVGQSFCAELFKVRFMVLSADANGAMVRIVFGRC